MAEISLRKLALLECVTCKKIWGTTDPGPMPYGILIEEGKTYSTEGCSHCLVGEDSVSLTILENKMRAQAA